MQQGLIRSRSQRLVSGCELGVCMLIAWACVACSADKPGYERINAGSVAGAAAVAALGGGGTGAVAARTAAAASGAIGVLSTAGRAGEAGRPPGISSLNGGTEADVQACAESAQEAQEVPVDMYIMLDRSDSMDEVTGAGPTKWAAIRSALTTFLGDARSNGLGVGLQFFPLRREGVPDACATDAECGIGGPCMNGVCQPGGGTEFIPLACATAADCPEDSVGCTTDVGQCSGASDYWCFNPGEALGCGFLRGSCLRLRLTGQCGGIDSCEAADYAQPAVTIGQLPANSRTLIDTLNAEDTVGRTPTAAALSGALQHAKAYAQQQPMHRVVAVLATDGSPTECLPLDPAGVGALAQAARAAAPAISTYVVGVFGPMETQARTNLNAWAKAGGTQTAFIVDPTLDVAAQFLDALDKIRSGSIACEYKVPEPPQNSSLDYDRVNVALIEGKKSSNFLYVGDASRCDRTTLGWHYDVAPSQGTPTKIVVCPQGCDALKTTDQGRVEVRVGCTSLVPD
ncbi:MAG: hypothetical protein RL701_6613 [Pseudomonadota bacterium]